MTNTAPTIPTTTYQFAHLNPAARKNIERHLVALGFGPKMTRRPRHGQEAARTLVTVTDAGDCADLEEFAALVGLEEWIRNEDEVVFARRLPLAEIVALSARPLAEILS